VVVKAVHYAVFAGFKYNSRVLKIQFRKDYLMRLSPKFTAAATTLVFLSAVLPSLGQDAAQAVAGGGITAKGWQGQIDEKAAKAGQTVNNTKVTEEGKVLHVTTGPAATFWNTKNKAHGNYTVSATFTEPQYMGLNNHPHPYGIVIAGNDLGTPNHSELYCATYGNGTFIVRGFGPEPFQVNGAKPEANDAVHKAAGKGEPVTQKIAVSVKGDKVMCSVNDVVVGTYNKSDVVATGKLKSLDGFYGIRFAHNTDGTVSGLKVSKN
jgi:hypothetical protein